MARVVRRAASAAAWRAPSRAIERRARKHKVIMESVTQEKKKLRSVICFEAKAPTGYTFIPAGNPLLTTACKERCRKEGSQIYAVSTTPHQHTHNLSQHVHRIGYHFPSTVVAAVCSELGLYLTNTGKAVSLHTVGTLKDRRPSDSDVSQEVINTEARDAIKDLFPNVPDKDLFQIIKTSFQKGQRKVGTASELPLARRAQLAVVAHVRHLYTDYDRLLKQGSFQEARSAVEQPTLAKVVAWRGDDENGQTQLEDVFREVIVISDDEDSETEEESATTDTLDYSVEILSNTPRTHEIQTQPISADSVPIQDATRELSEEAPPGFRIIPKTTTQSTINRRGFSRYQAWNRALHRYRAEAQGTEQTRHGDVSPEQQSPRYAKRPAATQESLEPIRRREISNLPVEPTPRPISGSQYAEQPIQRLPPGRTHVGTVDRRVLLEGERPFTQLGTMGRPPALTAQRPHEIRLTETTPRWNVHTNHPQGKLQSIVDPTRLERVPMPSNDRFNAPVFVGGPRELQQSNESQFGPRTELAMPFQARPGAISQDQVLPSIEAPWPLEKRRTEFRLEHLTKRMSLRSVTPVQPQGENHGNGSGPGSPEDQNCKRRRLAYYAGPHPDSRPDTWNARPTGIPVPDEQGPRVQYRRDELGPEHRAQDVQYLRRDHPPPGEQPLLIGHQRERQTGPFIPQVISLDSRRDLDRTHPMDSLGHLPMHPYQPSTGQNGMMTAGDRTFRATPDVSRPEVRSYYGDRSPRMEHIRHSTLQEVRPSIWNPRIDGDRPVAHNAPHGKHYADGFVRSVDVREARELRPVDYSLERPRLQSTRGPEISIQPSRTRIPDQVHAKDFVQPRATSEQRLPSPLVMHNFYHQTSSYLDTVSGNRQPQGRVPTPRERRPGSGLSTTRRVHDPRTFQMAEQNRPVYVQRVESQPPQYPMSDGRPVIVVD
ncbi:hypothetical protein N7466_003420 [Penicillium verhagenii]|uniref:uncharacterized protein n=1 Tax=Penicillium verhagenii TaxID=1562060 RepID=UPI0025458FED|nr:uncharacterized protein N7466_003420 [Penicillium verhagenii]KAJ5936970.1 hypothetical protein N7466_003420 [Penicillium verhagenii]